MIIKIMQPIPLKPLTRPPPDRPKVPTCMRSIAINIIVPQTLEEPRRNRRHIRITHDHLPEMVDTMLVVLLSVDTRLWIIIWIEVLAKVI